MKKTAKKNHKEKKHENKQRKKKSEKKQTVKKINENQRKFNYKSNENYLYKPNYVLKWDFQWNQLYLYSFQILKIPNLSVYGFLQQVHWQDINTEFSSVISIGRKCRLFRDVFSERNRSCENLWFYVLIPLILLIVNFMSIHKIMEKIIKINKNWPIVFLSAKSNKFSRKSSLFLWVFLKSVNISNSWSSPARMIFSRLFLFSFVRYFLYIKRISSWVSQLLSNCSISSKSFRKYEKKTKNFERKKQKKIKKKNYMKKNKKKHEEKKQEKTRKKNMKKNQWKNLIFFSKKVIFLIILPIVS